MALPLLKKLASRQDPSDVVLKRLIRISTEMEDASIVIEYLPECDWEENDGSLIELIYTTFKENKQLIELLIERAAPTGLLFPDLLRLRRMLVKNLVGEVKDELKRLDYHRPMSIQEYLIAMSLCDETGMMQLKNKISVAYFESLSAETVEKRLMAKRLFNSGQYSLSLRLTKSVLAEIPDDTEMLELQASIGHQVDRPKLVLDACRRLHLKGPLNLRTTKRMVSAATIVGDAAQIVEAMTLLAAFDTDYSSSLRNSFLACLDSDDDQHRQTLLGLAKSEPQRIDLEALSLAHEADYHGALAYLNEQLKSYPGEIPMLMRKANLQRRCDMNEEAILTCEQVLKIQPSHQGAAMLRTDVGTKVWSEEKALKEYELMVEQFPHVAKFHYQLLNYAYSAAADMEWAQSVAEQGLNHHPKNVRLQMYDALISAQLGDHEIATEKIALLRQMHPDHHEVLMASAQIEKIAGRPNQQLGFINRYLARTGYAKIQSSSRHRISPEFLKCPLSKSQASHGMVSVIMTTYKRDPLLDVAISSILNQTYPDIELIVVDDASPDDNFERLQEKAEADLRIRPFRMQQNGGTYLAKNYGLQQAKGKFISFMDSDDFAHPQKLERQVAQFVKNKQLQGVIHQCIRIDEDSNIEFRGVGSFRMSCISLMIRASVIEKMGYFDSLRVGADTEFIERIEAVFGPKSFLELPDLTLFMMRHSTSLTGGGPFHISWRSVAGPRLTHHLNFRRWHQSIRQGQSDGYLRAHLVERPFEVSDLQMSTHHQWNEGTPLFSDLIKARKENWWTKGKDMWQKSLSSKLGGREYVKQLGYKVPVLYWRGEDPNDIPALESLPERFVLKPAEGWSSNHVYCVVNGHDLLTHKPVTKEAILSELEKDEFQSTKKPEIMIEELLEPERVDVESNIPRDYKFYCFGGQVVMVHVCLRVSEVDATKNVHHYLDANFKPMPFQVFKGRPLPKKLPPKPDCWNEMMEVVQSIGRELNIFMRIDFFPTRRGAVFGEFTPTPHGGNGYLEEADRYLGTFWIGEEGVA